MNPPKESQSAVLILELRSSHPNAGQMVLPDFQAEGRMGLPSNDKTKDDLMITKDGEAQNNTRHNRRNFPGRKLMI